MGKELFPGISVKSLIVEFPTTPAMAVERLSVTLPMAMVITDGLGMKVFPLRLGSPAFAVRLTFTSVTLKPCRALSPSSAVS